MDGWMDGWMDGGMDGLTGGWVDGWMHACVLCMYNTSTYIQIFKEWAGSDSFWQPSRKKQHFGNFLLWYLLYPIVPKTVEKPFVPIVWGPNLILTRLSVNKLTWKQRVLLDIPFHRVGIWWPSQRNGHASVLA
jgi:hypothetical protein